MKYRQQKMLGAVRTKRMGRSSEAKAALRAKFIERARSYIGVVSSGAAAGGKWRSRVAANSADRDLSVTLPFLPSPGTVAATLVQPFACFPTWI